jgi:hypothetical protein
MVRDATVPHRYLRYVAGVLLGATILVTACSRTPPPSERPGQTVLAAAPEANRALMTPTPLPVQFRPTSTPTRTPIPKLQKPTPAVQPGVTPTAIPEVASGRGSRDSDADRDQPEGGRNSTGARTAPAGGRAAPASAAGTGAGRGSTGTSSAHSGRTPGSESVITSTRSGSSTEAFRMQDAGDREGGGRLDDQPARMAGAHEAERAGHYLGNSAGRSGSSHSTSTSAPGRSQGSTR